MLSGHTSARRARLAVMVLPLCAVLVQTACAHRQTTAAPISGRDSVVPNFVARVVSACRASGVSPATAELSSQVDLIVAIAPATVGNAGLIVGMRTPIYTRQDTKPPLVESANALRIGDELEVWHDGMPIVVSAQSPRGTPAFVATKIVVQRRPDQAGARPPTDTLSSCHY
jgi:hypothetical protein